MKIKFTESVTVPASNFEKELRFKKGSIHDLPEPSAYRWVRRNKAVYYVSKPAVVKLGRPMMKKPRKPARKDPGVVQKNIGPALPVKGPHNGGPGWDEA